MQNLKSTIATAAVYVLSAIVILGVLYAAFQIATGHFHSATILS